MKTVKIGEVEFKRMESVFDIGDERFMVFKQYILQTFENVDKPSFLALHNRIIKAFNAGNNYSIIVELENFKKGLSLAELNYDAFSICFALLHLGEGEEMQDHGTEKQKEKLKIINASEISRGEIESVVENFMIASPKHFAVYLGMLEAMKEISKGEILNALES